MLQLRPPVLSRPRLDARIAHALSRPIGLLYGGMGTGKSVALADHFVRSGRPFARCTLGAEVVSVVAFVAALDEALSPHARGTHLLGSIASELTEAHRSPGLALVAWLREQIVTPELTVVVDGIAGAQHIAPIAQLLAIVAEQTSDRLRWCFCGRDLGALPVASWLAHDLAELPLDASDLRFTADEAALLGAQRETRLPRAAGPTLLERTGGLPLTTSWAFDVLRDEGEVRDLPADAGAALDALLNATLAALEPAAVDALLSACVLPDLDEAVLAALPLDEAVTVVRHLAAAVPALFVPEVRPRFQSEIRSSLLRRSEADPIDHRRRLRAATSALERADRPEDALHVFTALADAGAIADLLAREGAALAERGAWTRIDPALARLEGTAFADEPLVLALRAASESNRDHFDTAEAWFRLALERSGASAEAHPIAQRFALEAMRRGRPDVVESLATRVLAHGDPESPAALAMRATLSTAYASTERHAEAEAAIAAVLEQLHDDVPVKARARILQQAAFVAVRAEAFERARALAAAAFADAVATGAYNVAALAQTLLYEVALEADDDPAAALEHLEDFARYAVLSGGERLHLFALLATFSLHVEGGNVGELERVERLLHGRELAQHTEFMNETLLPDQALRAAWAGDFERALRLAVPTVDEEMGARRRLRSAEVAVYAAAAGRASESAEASARADGWQMLPLAGRNGRTPALLAVAHLLRRETADARSIVNDALERGAAAGPRNAALFAAVDTLAAYLAETATPGHMQRAFVRLDAHHMGGYRRLLAALPVERLSRVGWPNG